MKKLNFLQVLVTILFMGAMVASSYSVEAGTLTTLASAGVIATLKKENGEDFSEDEQALIKAIQKTNEALQKQLDELKSDKASTAKAEELKTLISANQKELDALTQTAKDLGDSLKEAKNALKVSPEQKQSIRDQIKAAIDANPDQFEKFKAGEMPNFKIELKAAGTVTTSNITPDSVNVVSTGVVPGYVDILGVSPLVMNYCNTGRTDKATLIYVEKKNRDGSMVFVAEAAAKTQIDFDWEKETSEAKKVAPYIKVSDEMLDDVDFMAAAIENELRYQTVLEASEGVLSGDGTGANLKGITAYAQAYSRTDILTTTPNVYDCIRAMATQVKKNNGMATHVFIDPVDATNMGITKGTTGYYVVIDGMVQLLPYIIIENNQIGVGNLLVADMSKSIVRIYKDFAVQYGWENDDFTKDLVTVRGEMRLHHYIPDNHAPCFCYDTIADVKTATTAP